MDLITTAIVAALLVKERHGAVSASLQDAYIRVRDAIAFTSDSADELRHILASLEANPTSPARQLALYELLTTIPTYQRVTLRQLASDLVEYVIVQRHGERILHQLGVDHHGTVTVDGNIGNITIGNIAGAGVVLGHRPTGITHAHEAARPPGDPVILAKEPPLPPTTPEEQS